MAVPARRRAADVVAFALRQRWRPLFGLFWLVWILWTTLAKGGRALTPSLFTQMTPPPGASGGLLNAFYGSAVMILLALAHRHADRHRRRHLSCRARPLHSRLAAIVSFINDILLERAVDRHRPVRLRTGGAHRWAISPGWPERIALAMILLPIVVRTTDEIAAAGARPDARSRLRARPAALAGDAPHPLQARR